ncbi:MAG: cell envelope integrity protein CreD [Hyphomonadaceae bacterium]
MSDLTDPPRPSGAAQDFSRFIPQRSFGLKLLLVCALALLMAIPAVFVWGLIEQRARDATNAAASVHQDWGGGPQTLIGPVIAVPYERDMLVDNKIQTVSGDLVLYPETGAATATLTTTALSKGLQHIPVYTVDAAFSARFEPRRLEPVAPAGARVNWTEARLYLSASQPQGAQSAIVRVNGQALELTPSGGGTLSYQPLFAASLADADLAAADALEVTADLRFRGAQRFAFAPFAKNTTITVAGDWPDPKFDGGKLPDARTVTAQGFTASWSIPFLARGVPGAGADLTFNDFAATTPGVTLIDEANPYQKVIRALKYAPMFMGLVFLTYFLFETSSGRRAHPAQYVLVGLAQTVFYMLMLSISEIVGFTAGFIAAASATVLAISLYAGAVFGSRAAALRALGVFAGLYALIYVLLSMETYALLVGSLASFLAITGAMWMTRRLDWYGAGRAFSPGGQTA